MKNRNPIAASRRNGRTVTKIFRARKGKGSYSRKGVANG